LTKTDALAGTGIRKRIRKSPIAQQQFVAELFPKFSF